MESTRNRDASDGTDENTPLLLDTTPSPGPSGESHFSKKAARINLILLCITLVAVDFGAGLSYAPQIELIEEAICRNLYGAIDTLDHGPGVNICKSNEVQSELALINGWLDSLNQLPGLVLALPFGLLADRIGRKVIALPSLFGLIVQSIVIRAILWRSDVFPLRSLLVTPVFQVLGGGSQIASSMVFTMISDIFPAENRSAIFFIVAAVILLGEIVATPISAVLMTWNSWWPMILGVVFEIIGLGTGLIIRETMPRRPKKITSAFDEDTDFENSVDQTTASPTPDQNAGGFTMLKQRLHKKWLGFQQRHRNLLLDRNVLLIITAFLFASIGTQALQFVIQYVSKRFSWSMAEASFLITLKGIVNCVLLLLLLPQLSNILGRYMSARSKDILLVQGSGLLLTTGTAIMAFANSPSLFTVGTFTFALGWGFYPAIRSLGTGLVDPSQTALLNTAIAFVQGAGIMMAGPILAASYRQGIVLGGVWAGLPYMIAACLFAVATLFVFSIKALDNASNEPECDPTS